MCSLQVISGQQLPKVNIKKDSIVDPLVRVEIHGVPMDQAKQETRYIDNNGDKKNCTLNPVGRNHVLTVGNNVMKTFRNMFLMKYIILSLLC